MEKLRDRYEKTNLLLSLISILTFLQLILHFAGVRLPHLISFSAPSKVFLLSLDIAKEGESSLFLAFGIFTALILALLFVLLRRAVRSSFQSILLVAILYALDLIPLTIWAASDFSLLFLAELLLHLIVLFSMIKTYRAFLAVRRADIEKMLNQMFLSMMPEEAVSLGTFESEGASVLFDFQDENELSVLFATRENELLLVVNGEIYKQVTAEPIPYFLRIGAMVNARRIMVLHEHTQTDISFILVIDGVTVKEYRSQKETQSS